MTTGALRTWRAVILAFPMAAAACSDGVLAPDLGESEAPRALAVATSAGAEPVTDVFTVYPNRDGDFVIGGKHKISFPRHSICDPAKSTYGPSEWDKPCTVIAKPITITAVSWTEPSGHPRIEFSPALRFAPSRQRTQWVTLKMADSRAATDTTSLILYCGADGQCIDESLSDESLATKHDVIDGVLKRHIKHFSGYMVSASRSAESDL